LYIKRKKLEKKFSKHMTQRDTQEWLRLLEYRPERDLLKSPLIPVKVGGIKAYTLMTWVFTPSNHFWSAWTTDLLLEHPKLSVHGKWADQYGKTFQRYVDFKLVECKLPTTNLGSRKVSAKAYPEIKLWLNKLQRKEGFEVDRLVECGDVLFVVSCKARDYLYDRKVTKRDLFFPKEEFERRVEQNLQEMNTICIVANCIASCNKIRKELQLFANRFVPVLLTSMREPLSVSEVRSYYTKRRGVKLPKAHIVTIPQFIDIIKSYHRLSSQQNPNLTPNQNHKPKTKPPTHN